MNNNNGFERRFSQSLSDIPDMPDCYGEIVRRVKRKSVLVRATWTITSFMLISLSSVVYWEGQRTQTVHPDVAEELLSVQSHMNGEDIGDELISCSIVGDETDFSAF